MSHKRLRLGIAAIFIMICLGVMLSIYKLSQEGGTVSNSRSEVVTEKLRQEMNTRLNEKGLALSERVKYFVIAYSPYGSDWNANIRKLAHFTIYGLLGSVLYVLLIILGMSKTKRFFLVIILCFGFALADEFHQRYTGRTASFRDVLLDTAGSFTACTVLTGFSGLWLGMKKIATVSAEER